MRNGENIIFTEKDVVKAGNMLKAMLIRILIEKQITFDKFKKVLMEEHDEDDLVILIDYFNFCLG